MDLVKPAPGRAGGRAGLVAVETIRLQKNKTKLIMNYNY
jgi:hypothetical protein